MPLAFPPSLFTAPPICAAAVASILLLTGSSALVAGIYDLRPEFFRPIASVAWHPLTGRALQDKCTAIAGRTLTLYGGCATVPDDPVRICHVYAPMPKSQLDTKAWAIVGHEVGHCILGRWHRPAYRLGTPVEGS